MDSISLKPDYDYLAPDGSEIRLLLDVKGGGLAHCLLPPHKVSQAIKHRTVDEVWYILEGQGEIWLKNEEQEKIVKLEKDVCVRIPVATSFQFRNTNDTPLSILLSTMPLWPGDEEAIKVKGYWKCT